MKHFRLLFLGILLFSAFLQFETIAKRPLWWDETYTYNVVKSAKSLADIARESARDGHQHPPLYYAAVYMTMKIRDDVLFLRLVSALAGLASIALVILAGRRAFNGKVGLTAGFLMSISVYHVNYSQDARPYMLLVALTVAQYFSLYLFATARAAPHGFLFVLSSLGALYTSHLSAVTLFSLAAVLVWLLIKRCLEPHPDYGEILRHSTRYLAVFAAIGVLYLPQLRYSLKFLDSELLTPLFVLRPSFRLFHELFGRWSVGGPVLYLYEAMFLYGCYRALRAEKTGLGLFLWFAGPFVLFTAVPFQKYFDIRFLICALPAFFLITACGVAAFGERLCALFSKLRLAGKPALPISRIFVAAFLLAASLSAAGVYREFRTTETRCSSLSPDIVEDAGGFCRRHILLNTVIPEHRFMVSVKAAPSP